MGRFFSLIYLCLVLSPLLFLFLVSGESVEALDSLLMWESMSNTLFVSLAVIACTTFFGVSFAYSHSFFDFPGKKWLHILTLMPLALPAYVLAFVYMGLLGPAAHFDFYHWFELQASRGFLVFILSLAFLPYIYFFSTIGFLWVRQSERETDSVMQAGFVRYFRYSLWPKIAFFVVSGQVLVLFETLSDFGAASVVNLPVITTLIYKVWFDLFSFSGAARISMWFSLVILFILGAEFYLKSQQQQRSDNLDPLCAQKSSSAFFFCWSGLRWLYIFAAFILPIVQILYWAMPRFWLQNWYDVLRPAQVTLGLGVLVGLSVVFISILLGFLFKSLKSAGSHWIVFSSVGYGIPGTILAVVVYAAVVQLPVSLNAALMLLALGVGLVYKFLSIGLRPIGEGVAQLPKALDETSLLFGVSWWTKLRYYWFPYLRGNLIVAFLLTLIEVMKEMPISLMLAPSEYPTLATQIYNLTAEAQWEKASIPALVISLFGILSVWLLAAEKNGGSA
jgi:iron(III) transport system permease protein